MIEGNESLLQEGLAFLLQCKPILSSTIPGVNVNSLHIFGKGDEAKGLGCLQIACYCTSLNYSLLTAWSFDSSSSCNSMSIMLQAWSDRGQCVIDRISWMMIYYEHQWEQHLFFLKSLFVPLASPGRNAAQDRDSVRCCLAFSTTVAFYRGCRFFLVSLLMASNHLELWYAQKYLKARPFGKK